MMAYTVEDLSAGRVEAVRRQILEVYQAAFELPPYNRESWDVASFSGTLTHHMEREGFRCLAAMEDPQGKIVGFAYGYTSRPGQWWHDTVASALSQPFLDRWMEDAFELVELAVTPAAQGQGLGSQLHDRILEGLSHRTALLSTMQAETTALQLYRKRNWVILLSDFTFPGVPKPYFVMGRQLNSSH